MGRVEDWAKEPDDQDIEEDDQLYPYGPPPDLIREVNAAGHEIIRSRRGPVDVEAQQSLERKLRAVFAKELGGHAAGPQGSGPDGPAAVPPDAEPGPEDAKNVRADGAPSSSATAPEDPPLHDRASPREPETVPLRGELFHPDAPGCYPYSRPTPELKLAREDALPRDAETHGLLNAIIGECHYLMREVTFRSLCRSSELEDRMTWLTASMKLAETGARVGDSVARLLNGPEIRHTQHTQMVQHSQVAAVANAASGKPPARKSGKKKGRGRGRASP